MKTFTESDRHDYPSLNADSWVLDIGAHTGKTARILAEKYGCRVVCYEPIKEFYDELVESFVRRPELNQKFFAVNAGVGASARRAVFGVKGDLSGIACEGNYTESVDIMPIDAVMDRWATWFGKGCDLLTMNCEGMEFEILESLLDTGRDGQWQHLQVQPHAVVPNAARRWASIRNRLLMNYRITSEDPDIGTGWLLLERK